jgi:lysophospholipase L1-like esterase
LFITVRRSHCPLVARCLVLALQLLCLAALFAASAEAQPPTYRTWVLAEGAANEFFTEEILIGNPNSGAATVEIRLLPENGAAPPLQTITVPPTSRYTFRVNAVVSSGAVGAVVDSNLPVVVERSMYWAYGMRRGGHNSPGVASAADRWYLAEGTLGFFDTFVLITNSSATPATVEVTFLRQAGAPITTTLTVAGNGRRTIFVNNEFPQIASPFSTVVRQTNGSSIVVERAMYWNGYEGGHESTGVRALNTTWLFAEGATGGDASFDFQTYLLLANPGSASADVTIDFFRDSGGPVQYRLMVPGLNRTTLHLDELSFPSGERLLSSSSFSIKVTSTQPILAERSVYWSSSGIPFIDGHNTAGVNAEASRWVFAEGREGRFTDSGTVSYDTYFLFSNSSAQPLRIKGTFVREDGLGIVQTFTVNPTSRFTLLAAQFLELNNQRFAAFFEAVDNAGAPSTQTFVAERAMYWGPGYYGGHGSTGTPWPSDLPPIAAPPIVDLTPAITSVSPTHGPLTGGTPVTITGINFLESTLVEFGDRPATNVQHISATQMIATTPAGVALGPVSVKAMNVGKPIATAPTPYTYDAVVPYLTTDFTLAFGDSLTAGVTWTLCNMGGTMLPCSPPPDPNFGYPGRLRSLLQTQFPTQTIQVQAEGVPGECASEPGCVPSAPNSGVGRLPGTLNGAQDLVVILQGENDLNGDIPISTIINALQTMVTTARNAGKQVLLCTTPPVKLDERAGHSGYKVDPARLAALNAAIRSLATAMEIPYVDITAAFGNNYESLLSIDGQHPNGAGYQRMAEAIRDKIVERFEVRP